jgi:hypothetical protein
MSHPAAAARGVGALAPPNLPTHFAAVAAVRL